MLQAKWWKERQMKLVYEIISYQFFFIAKYADNTIFHFWKQASRGRKHYFPHTLGNRNFFKKPLWFINLANWLDSRFYMIYFNFHGVISFKELKMSWQIYPLDFVLVAKLSWHSHFPNSKTPGKYENYSVNPFVHTRFDRGSQNALF